MQAASNNWKQLIASNNMQQLEASSRQQRHNAAPQSGECCTHIHPIPLLTRTHVDMEKPCGLPLHCSLDTHWRGRCVGRGSPLSPIQRSDSESHVSTIGDLKPIGLRDCWRKVAPTEFTRAECPPAVTFGPKTCHAGISMPCEAGRGRQPRAIGGLSYPSRMGTRDRPWWPVGVCDTITVGSHGTPSTTAHLIQEPCAWIQKQLVKAVKDMNGEKASGGKQTQWHESYKDCEHLNSSRPPPTCPKLETSPHPSES